MLQHHALGFVFRHSDLNYRFPMAPRFLALIATRQKPKNSPCVRRFASRSIPRLVPV